MIRTLALGAGALLIAVPAQAQDRQCVGNSDLPGGSFVHAVLIVDDAGKVKDTSVYAELLSNGGLPLLNVDFSLPAPGGSQLGPVRFVSIGVMAPYPLPAAKTAIVRLQIGQASYTRAWQLYSQWRSQPVEPGSAGNKPVGYFGVIPFGEAAKTMEAAGDATIQVGAFGDDGVPINRGSFVLPGRSTIQEAADKALADARKAAKRPKTKCKPAPAS